MTDSQLDLSIVLPVYEEEESLTQLVGEIATVLRSEELSFEIICVDDGSKDQSYQVLRSLQDEFPELVTVKFRRNSGQSAAMQAGLDLSKGSAVAFMDSDLQNDPADIPKMWSLLWQGVENVKAKEARKFKTPDELWQKGFDRGF